MHIITAYCDKNVSVCLISIEKETLPIPGNISLKHRSTDLSPLKSQIYEVDIIIII